MARSTSPLVYILVLNWNGHSDTLECLASLDALDYEEARVLVIDNGSDNGSADAIAAARSDVELLRLPTNAGYAGGNNRGIEIALSRGAEFVWVLNNDTQVHPSALSELVSVAQANSDLAVLSSNVTPTGASSRRLGVAFTFRDGKEHHIFCDGCEKALHDADGLVGPSLFFRTSSLQRGRLFDEGYFHYFEERDLVDRIHRAGWRVGLACRAGAEHLDGRSLSFASPQAAYYHLRNRLRYELKLNGRQPLVTLAREPGLARRHLAIRGALRTRDLRSFAVFTLALLDALRGRGGKRDLGRRYQRDYAWAGAPRAGDGRGPS